MYLDSTTSNLNACLTKNGELQAIEGVLKYAYFAVGDSEIDYRLSDNNISSLKIMEASTAPNQSRYKLLRDLPENSTAPFTIQVSKSYVSLINGGYDLITISTLIGSDSSYNIENPRFDIVTLFGDNSSDNKFTQIIKTAIGNKLTTPYLSVQSDATKSTFMIRANEGLPVSESITLLVRGNDSGATQTITVEIN